MKVTLTFEMNFGCNVVENPDGAKLHAIKTLANEIPQGEVKITFCDCQYPKIKYRNGSGHSETCPTHKSWKQELNLNKLL